MGRSTSHTRCHQLLKSQVEESMSSSEEEYYDQKSRPRHKKQKKLKHVEIASNTDSDTIQYVKKPRIKKLVSSSDHETIKKF